MWTRTEVCSHELPGSGVYQSEVDSRKESDPRTRILQRLFFKWFYVVNDTKCVGRWREVLLNRGNLGKWHASPKSLREWLSRVSCPRNWWIWTPSPCLSGVLTLTLVTSRIINRKNEFVEMLQVLFHSLAYGLVTYESVVNLLVLKTVNIGSLFLWIRN